MPRDLLPPARFYLLKASQPEIVPPAEGQVTKSESPGEGVGILDSNHDDIFKYKHRNIFLSKIKLGLVSPEVFVTAP